MKTTKLFSHLGAVAAGVIGLSSGGNLLAAQGHALMHDRGTIESIAAQTGSFTLKDRHDASLGIHWDRDTRFLEHGKPIVAAGLKPGQMVSVAYEKRGDKFMAETVRILEPRGHAGKQSKPAS